MSFEWYVARRYLTARRRQAFISLISLVSIAGVGVGVMALVIALALMTGVQNELRDRIVGSAAHLYVYKLGAPFDAYDVERPRLARPGVVGVAPAILGGGLIQSIVSDTTYVMLKGVDPQHESEVTDIAASMKSGSLDALTQRPASADDGIVLGDDLARALGVKLGDRVKVITPDPVSTPVGPVPRSRILEVVGTFQFGFYEYDNAYGLVAMPTAESLLGSDGPGLYQLRLGNLDDAPRLHQELQTALGTGYLIKDWTEINGSLYQALWLEKVAISLTIGLIVMVAALNIVASLVLLVMEKSRDIAILRTMGASATAIRRIFIFQGLTIGLIGTTAGTLCGVLVSWLANKYHWIKLNADVYQITYIRFQVLPLDVAIVVISAVAVCYFATLYPSRQAGRLDPAEALRNQ